MGNLNHSQFAPHHERVQQLDAFQLTSAMTNSEDTAPQFSDYPYSWAADSGVTLDDFLKKVRPRHLILSFILSGTQRPSMVEDDGTKPVSVAMVLLERLFTLGLVDLGERLRAFEEGPKYGCGS